MIRTSCHHFKKFINFNKQLKLNDFVDLYKKAVQFFIDELWNNMDLNNPYCPKFISTKQYSFSGLSQRVLKCASTQACGIINGTIDLKRRRIFVINQLKKQNKPFSNLEKLVNKDVINKPIVNNLNCELNSICCDFKLLNDKHFDGYIQLKSLGKNFKKIRIPIKFHKQSNKWKKSGKLLNSFLVGKDFVNFRWENKTKLKTIGKTLGADQGQKTVLTLSDHQSTKSDKHGHDLNSIIKKLSLQKKGSKNFQQTVEHRKNYINWSINQLNLKNVKQINYEKILDLRRFKNVGRSLSHWTYTLIKDKLQRFCEENKVCFTEQNSIYRSQRCSQCGIVHKSNRQGKLFSCKTCGFTEDSDYNASCNHAVSLPSISIDLCLLKLNRVGFYWLETGLFDLSGKELTVPCTQKEYFIVF